MDIKEERNIKKYINVVKDMNEGACTSVKSVCGEMEGFKVRVGVHQGSALSRWMWL